jgi:hypothetical protein
MSDAKKGAFHLNDAYDQVDIHCRRLRALAQGICYALPADPFQHPMLKARGLEHEDDATSRMRIELRDALITARQLAKMVDDAACTMDDSASTSIESACEALELAMPKEASHG